jgi:hypothetical protein
VRRKRNEIIIAFAALMGQENGFRTPTGQIQNSACMGRDARRELGLFCFFINRAVEVNAAENAFSLERNVIESEKGHVEHRTNEG